jgi:hypothetical protein
MYTYVCEDGYACMHAYMSIRICIHACMHAYAHGHVCIHTYVRMDISTGGVDIESSLRAGPLLSP